MTIYIHRGGLVLLMTLFCMGFFSITLLQAEAAQSITEKYQIKNGQWRTESSLDDSSGRLNPGKGSNNPGRDDDDEEVEEDDDDDDRSSQSSRSRRSGGSLRSKINRLDDDKEIYLTVPVLGVEVYELYDSWGDPRSGGRRHEGIDIAAPRGTHIVSPTEAVVTKTGWGSNGGNYVYTAAPGGESFYYAHLDEIAPDLDVGTELDPGDFIGTVGDTGNAKGTIPHLHFTIYTGGQAKNPYPRMQKAFSKQEQLYFTLDIIKDMVERDEKDHDILLAIHKMYNFF